MPNRPRPAETTEPQEAAAGRILLVDEDSRLARGLAAVLEAHGYQVTVTTGSTAALRQLQEQPIDLVIADVQTRGTGGQSLVQQVHAAYLHIPIIATSESYSLEEAVRLIREGAVDFFPKPLKPEPLLESVARILREFEPQREQARAREATGKHLAGIVGRSREMVALFQQINRIAPSSVPVLISGETGTGKDLIASAIHQASGLTGYVPVNCGGIPDHLLESELFGHVRGAFTGAEIDKVGLFEAADGGTLFLDEIAELPLALQPKLLRALQSGEIRRVGDVTPRHVKVRLIAATHRRLEDLVSEGKFRADLYYRINVLRLDVPALRERSADIPLLAERHLVEISKRERRRPLRLSSQALAALVEHPWPGNVRELFNIIERAAVHTHGSEIRLQDLPADFRGFLKKVEPILAAAERELTLGELEKEYILAVLRRVGQNRTRAAEVLGIPRRTLYRRLEEYGVGAS